MNSDTRRKGRELLRERFEFTDKYMIYNRLCRDRQKRLHAVSDAHTHFTDFFSISPRLSWWSPQGGSGKSAMLQLSYFYVQNPLLQIGSGAGLLTEMNKLKKEKGCYSTLLLDECQNVLGPNGNTAVQDMLYSYTKGFMRTIKGEDGNPITQDLFCPAMTGGLTTKYDIQPNFLERTISPHLEKPLPDELKQKEPWLFEIIRMDMAHDRALAEPWCSWASSVDRSVMQEDQKMSYNI